MTEQEIQKIERKYKTLNKIINIGALAGILTGIVLGGRGTQKIGTMNDLYLNDPVIKQYDDLSMLVNHVDLAKENISGDFNGVLSTIKGNDPALIEGFSEERKEVIGALESTADYLGITAKSLEMKMQQLKDNNPVIQEREDYVKNRAVSGIYNIFGAIAFICGTAFLRCKLSDKLDDKFRRAVLETRLAK